MDWSDGDGEGPLGEKLGGDYDCDEGVFVEAGKGGWIDGGGSARDGFLSGLGVS